jgi:hypothetical protein
MVKRLVVHNFEEVPNSILRFIILPLSGLEKEFKQIKEDGYIAYYPDYIEINNLRIASMGVGGLLNH